MLRDVFQLVNREIWIVTAAHEARRGGLVATWVSQANLDLQRPEMQIAVAVNHFTRELIDGSGAFALHLISAEQVDLVWNFALGTGQERDKLECASATTAKTGAPILDDCLAWLDCRVFTQLCTGDRILYWADVVDAGCRAGGVPLREHDVFSAASPQQRQGLEENFRQDLDVQRPRHAAWRDNLPQQLS